MDSDARAANERFRKYAPELNLLLWAVWAPIPAGVPVDEYEGYVGFVWKLLAERAGVDAVAAALTRLSEERMGIGGSTSRAAAERLTEWWYWRFDVPDELEERA
jgi:hypothetical protein